MADEKKTERERVAAFLQAEAADAERRAFAWEARGMPEMADKKDWEKECAQRWAKAILEGKHDR